VSRADRLSLGDLDALVVTNIVNVRYLTGYSGSNGIAVVGADGARLFFTDFRYMTQAASEVSEFEVVRGERDLLGDVASAVSGRVGFEDASMPVRRLERLRSLVSEGASLVPAGDLVEALRRVKEPSEVSALRAAAAVADEGLTAVLETGLVGRTEHDVAVQLQHEILLRGAPEVAFPPIVASGAHGALPHASPRDEVIPADVLVTIDWGAVVDGYNSDCTRTYATGSSVSEEALETYELVWSVQASSVSAVRADAAAKEVDALGREALAAAGHGDHYGHGLGHGVGLDVHEAPTLSPRSSDVLAAGNAVTVEPGVYVPGSHGVRIEDLVIVTSDGCDVLSSLDKSLKVVD
jgi:Xaa-Pro aminopeptidase